ncbi:MAG: virulence factor SrfC family protein [Algoriphagus aquaeductus]|uniref:virulence factor SrfC family protein n=1 Tax=Algoriphagus aquaeductus TaxID=475299 RepID=UPI00391A6E68
MEKNIQKSLDIIEKSKTWIDTSLQGEKQKTAYRNIVNYRRALNKKKFALESFPAVAVYGESQVGKSYLISSLLSEEGKPFSITTKNGITHNFLKEINPIGGGSESTSLVSRFSVNYKPINSDFPIQATLLSPADIVLVLCDSYFHDIKIDHNNIIKTSEINFEITILKDRLKNRKPRQFYLIEDDILNIQDHFKENFSSKADNIISSEFFNEISLLISKAQTNEWKDIFSLLWNNNKKFSSLFERLISEYEKLCFSNLVYLPIESVLLKHGTLLDVERLKEIYAVPKKIAPEYKSDTTLLFTIDSQERQISFRKSILCALCAELVFHQNESLVDSKPFLKETDLLDFPGARGRMTLRENDINEENIPQLLIRGKIAYLFNKYSEAEKISIFMLCAKHEQAAQRSMPQMLSTWIDKFIGDTPEKRDIFIQTSQIPPLFIIGTFFNVNLQYNPLTDKPEDHSSLNERWHQRFDKTLSTELIDTGTYSWFNNWTKTSPNFRNIYLLRDFVYSEFNSNLFKGYQEHKKEIEEIKPADYPDFRQHLRQSFIEYNFVKKHFNDPAASWDESATINKDGSKLIIDRLTVAANNINKARREKIISELQEISDLIVSELQKYYHSNDKDEELQKAKSIAGNIQHKLDFAFSADGIKEYGKMMREFMLNESSVLQLFRKKIDDIEHRDIINLDAYSTYRMHVPVLDGDTEEKYFDRLCTHYEKITEEQKQEFRSELESKKIDLEELISGSSNRIKNNANQLAEALLEYWFVYINLNDKHTIRQILEQDGSSALEEITEMYQKLFKKVGITKKIAENIKHHVDGQSKTGIPYEIIADISAELLNKCINTVGFEYFDESEIHDLQLANEKNKLGLVLSQVENPTEKSVEELFDRIENWSEIIQYNPEKMKSLPSYRNYLLWYNRLKVGFVSVCDIPNYDVNANEKLGVIIKESETIKYH